MILTVLDVEGYFKRGFKDIIGQFTPCERFQLRIYPRHANKFLCCFVGIYNVKNLSVIFFGDNRVNPIQTRRDSRKKLNNFKIVQAVTTKLIDLFEKLPWEHFKVVVTLQWQASFGIHVFSKFADFFLKNRF